MQESIQESLLRLNTENSGEIFLAKIFVMLVLVFICVYLLFRGQKEYKKAETTKLLRLKNLKRRQKNKTTLSLGADSGVILLAGFALLYFALKGI